MYFSQTTGYALVRRIEVPEGFDHLDVCSACNFVGLDLQRHVCGVVLNRYTGNVFVPPSTSRVVLELVSPNDPLNRFHHASRSIIPADATVDHQHVNR